MIIISKTSERGTLRLKRDYKTKTSTKLNFYNKNTQIQSHFCTIYHIKRTRIRLNTAAALSFFNRISFIKKKIQALAYLLDNLHSLIMLPCSTVSSFE